MGRKKKTTGHSGHTHKVHKSGTYSQRGLTKEINRPRITDGTDRPLRLPGWLNDWKKIEAGNYTRVRD